MPDSGIQPAATTGKTLKNLLAEMQNGDWLDHCRSGTPELPAGLTYLSQLLAHDIVNTRPRANVLQPVMDPHHHTTNVNLVANPLMLNTVYGLTGVTNRRVYKEKATRGYRTEIASLTMFRMHDLSFQGARRAVPDFAQSPQGLSSEPMLADDRNLASPILMQITAAFMDWHNQLVIKFAQTGHDRHKLFALARATAVRTWHNIIAGEIIEGCCSTQDPAVALPPTHDRMAMLTQGVMRSFHSLIRPNYLFNGYGSKHTASEMISAMRRGPDLNRQLPSTTMSLRELFDKEIIDWMKKWGTDWNLFFDTGSGKAENRTRFSPSFALGTGNSLLARDLVAGGNHSLPHADTFSGTSPHIDKLFEALAAVFADAGWATWHHNNPVPAIVGFAAEAFFTPEPQSEGKLGRVGSALFRKQIGAALNRARNDLDQVIQDEGLTGVPKASELPGTFMKMVTETQFNFIRETVHV